MKNVCSNCGEFFEGVICTNCGQNHGKTTIITVSKPVYEEESIPNQTSERTLKALEKSQKKAQRANEQVERLQRKEERRNSSAAKREHRLVKSEQSENILAKIVTQFRHVLSLSATGATRQAIHFVISPRGCLAFILLIPLCMLIPLIIAVSCVLYAGVDTSPQFLTAVLEVLKASAPAALKALLFWLELCAVMVLYLRAHAFSIGSAMTFRRAVGLTCVSQLPVLFLSPFFAVCLFIFPVVSLLLAILAIFQFIIMIFVGVEFAAMDKRRGVFTSFSFMLGAFICTAAAISAFNFPVAAEYIYSLISRIYL